jgi:hypothetical protein
MVREIAQIDNRSITDKARAEGLRRGKEGTMDRTHQTSQHRRASRRAVFAAVFVFGAAIGLEGCGAAHPADSPMAQAMPTMAASADAATASRAAEPQMAGAPGDPMPADASEAWAGRPDFVRADPQTEEAYAYALYHPGVVQWMPCYCGCARMDHRSNLDCYLKRAVPGQASQFEEHASYCEICVKTTLLTKQLMSEGKSLREIRQAVDSTFGGTTEGTPTGLPPA